MGRSHTYRQQTQAQSDINNNKNSNTAAILGDSRGIFACRRVSHYLKSIAKEVNKWHSLPMMVAIMGFPNVGKSTLINSMRQLHGVKGSVQVGKEAGVTRHISAFRICSYPLIHILDTPGIYMPALKMGSESHAEIGMKLALCGCIKDNVIGSLDIAEYLLWLMNERAQKLDEDQQCIQRYMDYCGVQQPFTDIERLMLKLGAKNDCHYQRFDHKTGLNIEQSEEIDIHRASEMFIQQYRLGHFDRYLLDKL